MPRRAVQTENLVAIERAAGVELKFLGDLMWYTLTENAHCTRWQLEKAFYEGGLESKYLPKERCARDAFRRATKAGELRREPFANSTYLNIMIRDVRQNSDVITRQMVREIVDGDNVRLMYLPVATLTLSAADETQITMAILEEPCQQELAALERIKAEFEIEANHYNGRTVRDIVQTILWACCDPVNVRPQGGGVYFIPEEHRDTMQALKAMTTALNGMDGTGFANSMWSIPVVDAEEQRKMLQASLEDQVKDESNRMITEIRKVISDGRKVTPHLAEQFTLRARRLSDLVRKYEDKLETEALTARSSQEMAMGQALALLDRVEVE